MDLGVDLGGLHLKNPVMSASGTFGYGLEFASFGDLSELGAIVVKGLSLEPRTGKPVPRIAETPCGMLNAIGLQNVGVKRFLEEKLPDLPWDRTPVIANLYGQGLDEFGELAEILGNAPGVAALEINISCPNVRQGGVQFGQDPEAAARVVQEVKANSRGKTVIVKLSPNVADIREIARSVQGAGADVISLINTLTGMAVDVHSRAPRLASVFGGLSGPAIKPVALRMVYEVCREVDVPVIGVGGISSTEDILEFILVGAHAVQVGTANFMRPDLIFDLVRDLPGELSRAGVSAPEELRNALRTD